MNHPQPPGQQPGHTTTWGQTTTPGQPYPGPYGPPPPPKKRMSPWAIAGITIGGFFAFLIVLGIAVGDPEATDEKATGSKPTPTVEAPAAQPSKAAPAKKTQAPAEPTDKPKPAPKTYDDGDYIVGEDIPAGTYTTPGAESGAFELCMISTKPTSSSVFPQLKSANANERIIITLAKKDGVVTISGCEPLTLRK